MGIKMGIKMGIIRHGIMALVALPAGVATYGLHKDSTLIEDNLHSPLSERNPSYNSDTLPSRYIQFFTEYQQQMVDAAKRQDVPVECIAAAVVEENERRPAFQDWMDSTALAWNASLGNFTGYFIDPSLGPGQVNVSTALALNHKYHVQMTREAAERQLQNPEDNIRYIGLTLAEIMHRNNRITSAASVFDDSHLIEIVGTEYVKGKTETPLAEAKPSFEGVYYAWALSNIPSHKIFGENAAITVAQQDSIRAYAKSDIAKLTQ